MEANLILPKNINKIKSIFDKACVLSLAINLEELNCNSSFCRIKTNKTYNDIFGLVSRKKYWNATCFLRTADSNSYYEFCFSIGVDVQYFIWVMVSINNFEVIKNQFLKGEKNANRKRRV